MKRKHAKLIMYVDEIQDDHLPAIDLEFLGAYGVNLGTSFCLFTVEFWGTCAFS